MKANKTWSFDFSHSRIGFSVKHFGITQTDGLFKKYSGKIRTDKDDFSDVQVELSIETDSIETNDAQRDAHLRSPDFFEVEKFPLMIFKSTSIATVGKGMYKLSGDLTIKGLSKTISFDLEFAGIVPKDPFGNTKAGFILTGKINRKDWGITWNAALDHGGVAVSDEVKISCPIQLLMVPNE
ncbi:YceI family protein [Pseudochryseolinea flava]|uniref:Polyisoprenoid-binding protein n=1 Tax=Pseudochryseolinea flava TaxID=2059302 RepID=A0A364Y3L4_9BACT|nr:YceI family protein [Pseudochryseolinea flava]RAW01540.1 polyisoprenoid-binding protein [Pseudochryseolinea flava]